MIFFPFLLFFLFSDASAASPVAADVVDTGAFAPKELPAARTNLSQMTACQSLSCQKAACQLNAVQAAPPKTGLAGTRVADTSGGQPGTAPFPQDVPATPPLEDMRAPGPWEGVSVPTEVTQSVMRLPMTHPDIKAVPIQDSKDPLIDLAKLPARERSFIRPMADFDDQYAAQLKERGPVVSQVRREVYDRLTAMVKILQQEATKQDRWVKIGIAYFQGYRPLTQQMKLFMKEFSRQYKRLGDGKKAYLAAACNVTPAVGNAPPHTTGGALDMTLFGVDKKGNEVLLDMGRFGLGEMANEQQATFSVHTTDDQRSNRLMLLKAAQEAGFVNYGFQWWHFEYGTRAYAYAKGLDKAMYHIYLGKDAPRVPTDEDSYIHQLVEGVKKMGRAIPRFFRGKSDKEAAYNRHEPAPEGGHTNTVPHPADAQDLDHEEDEEFHEGSPHRVH